MKKKPLLLRYHSNTLKHLGINLYSTLPPVIAEIIANAYDAYAHNVSVIFKNGKKKTITIIDDGEGMSYNDFADKYLEIGRNRRLDDIKGDRKPIGKKGLGKLSGFGISEEIIISSVKGNIKNTIKLNYKDIINSKDGIYAPQIIEEDKRINEPDGTVVTLQNIGIKYLFTNDKLKAIANDLSYRFSIFNEDFLVNLKLHGKKESLRVTDELKYEKLDIEFKWMLPLTNLPNNYKFKNQVIGEIIATQKPTPAHLKGIHLLSRGKLVNQRDFFGSKDDDYAYTYLTGWLSIDFIEKFPRDIISTNRESLNWEDPDASELQEYLFNVLKYIKKQWRIGRKEKKKKEVEKRLDQNMDEWLESLPIGHKRIANKIINSITESENIGTEKAVDLISYIQGSFEFDSFKYYAEELLKFDTIDTQDIIKLIKDWNLVESREMYNLSQIRINAIDAFEKHIAINSLEVPVMHDFLKNFSWILDPRIMNFEDEVYYSKMLKKKFEDLAKEESNKRIDFLCVNFASIFFVIELKRPQSIINLDFLNQAIEYQSFIQSKLGNENQTTLCTYIVGGSLSNNRSVVSLSDSLRKDGKVYFKSYSDLLSSARRYHQEFIEKYEKLKILKKDKK
jgi:hypothetical protein